ncbi:MAG: nucleotidyl transferase AbiEii/AbiGii toxin family protein [Blastocatellia bacterium]|nr:nucleotidyl transferase AbiEii/AbiGii toxin family protein [Blastocatellia bacterium]
MLNADVISFREFMMHEPLPLSKIQQAVLEFLQGRDDAVLFGAQAVNAYVDEPRATQDVDIMSNRPKEFAEELREHLSERFHIPVRVREIAGKGLRIYQVRKEGNRHLVDVRIVNELPPAEAIGDIQVLTLPRLIASKVISYDSRRGKPKSGTDWRDLAILLNGSPELKKSDGEVADILHSLGAPNSALTFWNDLIEQDLSEDDDDDLTF